MPQKLIWIPINGDDDDVVGAMFFPWEINSLKAELDGVPAAAAAAVVRGSHHRIGLVGVGVEADDDN